MAARRNKKKPQPSASRSVAPLAKESRPAEWATIGWLLASLTTAACLGVWAGVRVAAFFATDAAPTLRQVAGFLLFAAVAVGVANLALCAAAHGLRTAPPPRPLLWFSLLVGLLPMMLLWLA
jgi:uncharacterized membrane-anchored protein